MCGSTELRDYVPFDKPWCTQLLNDIEGIRVIKRGRGHTIIFEFKRGSDISIPLSKMRVPKLFFDRMGFPNREIGREEWSYCVDRILHEFRER